MNINKKIDINDSLYNKYNIIVKNGDPETIFITRFS